MKIRYPCVMLFTLTGVSLGLAGYDDRRAKTSSPPPTVIPAFKPWREPARQLPLLVVESLPVAAAQAPVSPAQIVMEGPPLEPDSEENLRNMPKAPKSFVRTRNPEKTGAFIIDRTLPDPVDNGDAPLFRGGM